MRTMATFLLLGFFMASCSVSRSSTQVASQDDTQQKDTVRIANDSLEYEIIIIEPGFNSWLLSTAKPEGYYSQQYMEVRNLQYVTEWNQRVMQPLYYNSNLYEFQIDYQPNIDYGYEVNYKLYNYFIYFQLTYNQRLGPFVPRI